MKNVEGKAWKHSGRQSGNYARSISHDHDRRTYASAENHFGKGPKDYKRSDAHIEYDVCETLLWNPDVDASEIEVSVMDGNVTLSGFVDSRHAKKVAESAIEHLTGVSDVSNKLILKKDLDLGVDKIIARSDDGLFSQEIIHK